MADRIAASNPFIGLDMNIVSKPFYEDKGITPPAPQVAPSAPAPAESASFVSPKDKKTTLADSARTGFFPSVVTSKGREMGAEQAAYEAEVSKPAGPSPGSIQSAMKVPLAMVGMAELDMEEEAKKYNSLIPNFDKKMAEARSLYEKKEADLGDEQAKVAMFKILGHLAMGVYGAKYGVDTSGIQFDSVDWSARHKKLVDQYKMDVDLAEGDFRRGESRFDRLSQLSKWARAEGEQVAGRETTKQAQLADFKARQLLGQAGDQRQDRLLQERQDNAEAVREEKALRSEQIAAQKLAQKETQEIDKLKTSLAKETKSGKRKELAEIIANRANLLSYADWKESAGAEKGWLSTDTTDYINYVKQSAGEPNVPPETKPSTPAPQPASMIKVRSPNGEVGSLPAGKLEEALRKGYTRI
jgi:hypothetical protein